MRFKPLRMIFLGLSVTSSWGNGHATTYRGLLRALSARGHRVLFLERSVPWYSRNRDLKEQNDYEVALYSSTDDLRCRFCDHIRKADLVCVGSYVPQGIAVGEWVLETASGIVGFYDIDTPVTLATLETGENKYLTRDLIARYHLYLSFTGGPTLHRLEREFCSPKARPLYCAVDPELYYPERSSVEWDIGYLGTYSKDRQPALEKLMLEPARRCQTGRFIVAGPQYPSTIEWPQNVSRVDHVPPPEHRRFYNAQKFTLNITRADMLKAGFSPSVRLFEAAACGTPIISDDWCGLSSLFEPGKELLLTHSAEETLGIMRGVSATERSRIGDAARRRVLSQHTAAHRALELEGYVLELMSKGHTQPKSVKPRLTPSSAANRALEEMS